MGEFIKNYGQVKLKGTVLNVELNGPIDTESGGVIHIQNDHIRFEMSQQEFYHLVGCLNLAKTNLQRIKTGGALYE